MRKTHWFGNWTDRDKARHSDLEPRVIAALHRLITVPAETSSICTEATTTISSTTKPTSNSSHVKCFYLLIVWLALRRIEFSASEEQNRQRQARISKALRKIHTQPKRTETDASRDICAGFWSCVKTADRVCAFTISHDA